MKKMAALVSHYERGDWDGCAERIRQPLLCSFVCVQAIVAS